MIYKLENNKILVLDKTQFNPEHILECGQVFRFNKDKDGNYYVISKNHKATLIEKTTHYEILCDDITYFINYFDLDTDYNKIKQELSKNKILAPMIKHGYGIRILKADPAEMIFSYIISQNNNIKRIQAIIERLCVISKNMGTYKAFPTIEELSNQPLEFYQTLGAGYRDKFLKSVADTLNGINFEDVLKLQSTELYEFLISLNGVGPKVASCILLFGFHKTDKFPVDTWIEQVYYNHFSKEKRTRPEIQIYFEDAFGEYSGIAQQYLFYYEREKNKG